MHMCPNQSQMEKSKDLTCKVQLGHIVPVIKMPLSNQTQLVNFAHPCFYFFQFFTSQINPQSEQIVYDFENHLTNI